MKVAIDIRRMTEFGVGTYTRNVVRALGRLDHANHYFLIGAPKKEAIEIRILLSIRIMRGDCKKSGMGLGTLRIESG